MNNSIEQLIASMQRLQAQVPDMPFNSVLLSRILLQLGRGIGSMLEQQIRPFGLAEAEFRVLVTLFSQPQGVAHPTDLRAGTAQSPANMSRICDALVERGFITRVSSVHDRRKLVLHVTTVGEDVVRRLLPSLFAPLRNMFRDFSEQEQVQMIGQLQRLGTRLDVSLTGDQERPT